MREISEDYHTLTLYLLAKNDSLQQDETIHYAGHEWFKNISAKLPLTETGEAINCPAMLHHHATCEVKM